MSVTPQAFHFHLNQLAQTEKYLIAYSGGVDSHVLLHLCSQLKNSPGGFDQSFSAVYIDHGLNYHSKKWGRHCQHICFELDIPLTIIEVDAKPAKGQSPEASARIARYQAFGQLLDKNECLLTAQHLDDQAETLLLQLLRGSGVKGLSAMPRSKIFAEGFLCRPMLDYKKQDILAYAEQHQLEWIDDDSNLDERYDRNYLRHSVLPLLAERWPAVQENFAKSAELLAESQLLMDELAGSDIHSMRVINQDGITEADKLLLQPLLNLLECGKEKHTKRARLNNLLRHWINLNHMPMPSKKILEQIIVSVIQAREDAMPVVRWRREEFQCELRKYRDKLYLFQGPVKEPAASDEYYLTEDEVVEISHDQSTIKLLPLRNKTGQKGFDRQKLLARKLTIRFRQGGERFRSSVRGKTQQLKHWFQEQGIPPWERDLLPLIYWGDDLIQVGNDIVDHSAAEGYFSEAEGSNPKAEGSVPKAEGSNPNAEGSLLIICWIKQDLDEIKRKKR